MTTEAATMIGTRIEWADDFLDASGWGHTEANQAALLAWMQSEEGDREPAPYAYNPLLTSLDEFGAVIRPGEIAANYPTWADGLAANVATLHEDHPGYANVRQAFEHGNDALRTVDAIHDSVWGSKPDAGTLAYVRSRWDFCAALVVGDRPDDLPSPDPDPDPDPDPTPDPVEDPDMRLLQSPDEIALLTGSGHARSLGQGDVDALIRAGVPGPFPVDQPTMDLLKAIPE